MSDSQVTKEQQRYCIGCKHLLFKPHEHGRAWSDITFDSSTPAEFACRMGYWSLYLDDISGVVDLEKAMEHAKKCGEYMERS